MTSRFTALIREHALDIKNNNDQQQPPTLISDNHVRIDFSTIRDLQKLFFPIWCISSNGDDVNL
jgi:hypothetical protein